MTHSALWLAQIQFFLGFGFMLLFMALELGLAWVLVFFKIKAITTGKPGWLEAYRFWVRVFALACAITFAGGVATFLQFASLWSQLIPRVGDVLGPMIAAAVVTAFIVKAGLLGAMLFGSRNFPSILHALVVVLVATGITASAFFIIVAVSWTHTPVGTIIFNGQYVPVDGVKALLNPSMPWYGLLFLSISFIGVGFLIMAVISSQTKRNPINESYGKSFSTGLVVAVLGIIMHTAAVVGSVQMAATYQPAKAAALAGYWQSSSSPDLLLFGWPSQSEAKNYAPVVLENKGAAWLAYDSKQGHWRGLDQFSGMMPPVALTFWSFRLMVLAAGLLALISFITWLSLWKNNHDPAKLSHRWRRLLIITGPCGAFILLCGLAYTQFGALPYAVYGSITLTEVFSNPKFAQLAFINVLYLFCYLVLGAGFWLLLRYISRYGVVPVGRHRRRA